MTRDPAEGVDAGGAIVTGAAIERVPAAYRPVVADCTLLVRQVLGDRLHGLYLYGSVATGQARPPGSDLDLLAVSTSTVDPAAVAPVEATLSTRHAGLVREVSLASASLAEVLAGDRDGLGWRCFIRHYCVPVAGTDLRPELPSCRPSRAVADGFNDDVAGLVRRWRTQLAAARTPADVAAVARCAARKLLLVVSTLESVEHGGWTTDRAAGATLLAAHHPEWSMVARSAVDWCAGRGDPTTEDVYRLLSLGDWLARMPDAEG
ncbi:MAG: nucleotidyltransferase domain-containing protein [Micromonosporaceae bacterium]|nr:nucleotidyltransferase domain-containing protein [Micromonosporaceae bacterium]